jgi:hypothetical protein
MTKRPKTEIMTVAGTDIDSVRELVLKAHPGGTWQIEVREAVNPDPRMVESAHSRGFKVFEVVRTRL